MAAGKKTVAVVSAVRDVPADVTGPLSRAGFAVVAIAFNETPPSEAVAVLIVVDASIDTAVAFTRRQRVSSTVPRPILWLLTLESAHNAATAFDVGAEACLVRPVDPDIFLAQLNALLRTYSDLVRVVVKGGETVDLTGRLAKQFRQVDADADFARRTLASFAVPPLVGHSKFEAEWVFHPAAHGGVCVAEVVSLDDRLRFALCTVSGLGVQPAAVLAQAVLGHLLRASGTPAEGLAGASRHILELDPPETAMVAATLGRFDATGRMTVACGGHPPPVIIPAEGQARLWHGAGAFLGQSDLGYSDLTESLELGDRVLLLAGGAAADKRPDVRASADDHRRKPLAGIVRQVANEVFTPTDAEDGYVLLGVGRTLHLSEPG